MHALVVLAEGFEELEAAAPITILRRAKVDVTTAGLTEGVARGARGIPFVPDTTLERVATEAFDVVVLPGGMPGTIHLQESPLVAAVVRRAVERGAIVAAICAAPSVLGRLGLLEGRKATSHDTVRDELVRAGAKPVADEPVVQDGKIVTSRGAGTAVPFGLHLVRMMLGEEKAREVAKGMMLP